MWIKLILLVVYCGFVKSTNNSKHEIFPRQASNFLPPEKEVTFHLYHRNDLTYSDELMLEDPRTVLNSRFDPSLPTTMVTHGWTHGKDVPWVVEMREAMALKGIWNVIIVDWMPLSHSLYTEARIHTRVVGKQIAKLCIFLNKVRDVKMSDIHLIGHSMGGQVSALAGFLVYKEFGSKVGRITGLDPAAPLYEWPHYESSDEVLDRGDAEFVDVIHTNGRHLGMMSSAGHVDFYPNGGIHQPGCSFWVCSHLRACEFWTASIKNPYLFRAYSFDYWEAYLAGEADNLPYYPMGIAAGPGIPTGSYFTETVAEMLTADPNASKDRKFILPEDKYNSTNFLTLWDFEGVFKYSPLFYGWYTNRESKTNNGYRLPFAYFVTGLVVYGYSFFATLRKMAENSRMSKLSEKDDECIFSWKLFCAWDYMIGNAETAHNRVASIVMGFKEALLEEAEKKREPRNWKIIGFRVLVNTVVLSLLSFSVFTVILVVKRSTELESMSTLWRRNEITIVLSLISLIFPMVFEVLGFLEQYHPRKQLRLQLARIMVLNLLNLYALIFALFDKIFDMTKELQQFRNLTLAISNSSSNATTSDITNLMSLRNPIVCYEICYDIRNSSAPAALMKSVTSNISATVAPILTTMFNVSEDYYNSTLFPNDTWLNETWFNETFDVNFAPLFNFREFTNSLSDYLSYLWSELSTKTRTTLNLTVKSYNFTSEFNFSLDDFYFENTSSWPSVDWNHISLPISSSTTTDQDISTTSEIFSTTEENYLTTPTSTLFTELSTSTTSYIHCRRVCNFSFPPIPEDPSILTNISETGFNYTMRSRLRSLCWETMFGQELVKLTIMDLIMTLLSTLALDFFRGIFVRVMNRCWCWDLEKKFPQYGDFKVAENILHLVYNQGMVWMGLFFSPGLVVLNVLKLFLMMYLRAWAVLTCNAPPEIIFRASRSNNFYYGLLLMMLFLCVLPVGFATVWIEPSWHCGPFSNYKRIFRIFTETITDNAPKPLALALEYIASPGIVIPLLVLLILVIYYLVSLTSSLREANADLKIQLRRERTEERRKMFQLADRRRRGGSSGSGDLTNAPYAKWKKLLGSLPSGKSIDDNVRLDSSDFIPQPIDEESEEHRGKDFFTKFIKKALGKSSTSDEENPPNLDDGTDTEQHDSLPEDLSPTKDSRPQFTKIGSSTSTSTSSETQRLTTRTPSLRKNEPKFNTIKEHGTSDGKRVIIQEAKVHLPSTHRQRHDGSNQQQDFSSLHEKRAESDQHRDHKRNIERKRVFHKKSTSTDSRQDSGSSSIWSDNVPVITISKTESDENIIDVSSQNPSNDNVRESANFKPKVKYALRKQSTEIDEDVMFHFGHDLDQILVNPDNENDTREISEALEEGQVIVDSDYAAEVTKSSSDEAEYRGSSADTVIDSALISVDSKEEKVVRNTGSIQTESSSGYKDSTFD